MEDSKNTFIRSLFGRLFALLGTVALVLFLAQAAGAVTINVTTTAPGVNADGQCSLEEAIDNANDDAATHGDCTAGGGGADVIELANGAVYNLDMVVGTTHGDSGLPEVSSVITINGNGSTIQRDPTTGPCDDSGTEFRIITVASAGDLTLNDVTLSNGCSVGLANSALGGAIFVDSGGGILVVNDSTISGNEAVDGGGIYNRGTVDIDQTTISGNDSSDDGGGIWNDGPLNIRNSTISGNNAGNIGGGIYNDVDSDMVEINNSTISGNDADDDGGGIFNDDSGFIDIHNSTITGNSASSGGGIFNDSADLELENTIVANQSSGADCDGSSAGVILDIASNGWNLASDGTCTDFDTTCPDLATGPCDQINANPQLGPLQDNGGPTFTHALPLNSPALDMGDSNGCEDTDGVNFTRDQRNFPRPVDGDGNTTSICDIGAYEAGGIADLSIVKIANPDPVMFGAVLTYTVTITNNGPAAAFDAGFTDTLPGGTTFVPNSFVLDGDFPDPNENCNHVAGLITCMLNDTLTPTPSPPTDTWTISYQVTVNAMSGTINNTAIITSNQPDDVPGNNNTSAGTTVGEPLDVDCDDVLTSTDPGLCSAVVLPGEVLGGPVGGFTLDLDPPPPYPLGTTMVTLMVMDGEGGFGTCEADITVLDGELPVMNNCPVETIIVQLDQEGQQPNNIFIFPTAIDNCDGVLPVVCTHQPDDDFPSSNTTVECTATDEANNVGVCEFDVIVQGGNGCGCMIPGPVHAGTTAANALLPLIPLLAVGLRAMLRRRRNKG